MSTRRSIPLAAVFLLAACGSPPPPSATPPEPASSAGPPVAATSGDPAASAAPAANGPSASPSASPAATAAATAGSPGTMSETHADPAQEECQKSAIPYEEKVRPLFNECYRAGKKKNPDLQGSIRINLSIGHDGKVTSTRADVSELGSQVVDCMVKQVNQTAFDGSKCKGKSVAIGKTYGRPS